jgi:hypothetical protein
MTLCGGGSSRAGPKPVENCFPFPEIELFGESLADSLGESEICGGLTHNGAEP